jgi:hypothetical protein
MPMPSCEGAYTVSSALHLGVAARCDWLAACKGKSEHEEMVAKIWMQLDAAGSESLTGCVQRAPRSVLES